MPEAPERLGVVLRAASRLGAHVHDQRLVVTEGERRGDDAQLRHERVLQVGVAVEREREHAAVAAPDELPGRDLVVGVVAETRIGHERDARIRVEQPGDGRRGGEVLLQAQGQRHRSAQDQPGVERRDHPAHVDQRIPPDAVDEPGVADDRTAEGVTVAVDVLREGVDDEVGPVVERPVERGRGEGAVDREDRAHLVRDIGETPDVGDLRGGIGDGLDVDHARLGPQRRPHRSGIGHVDEGRLDAVPLRQQLTEQAPHGFVSHVGDDDVIAALQEGEEHRVQCRDPRREHRRRLAALHRGELALERDLVDAAVPGVDEPLGVGPVDGRGILREHVGVRHHERRPQGAGAGVGRVAAVHRPRGVAHGIGIAAVRTDRHPPILPSAPDGVHTTACSGDR